MSLAEIEAHLERLTPDELRQLAVRSWRAFVEKEFTSEDVNQCSEDDPKLLDALDKAVAHAETVQQEYTAEEVRDHVNKWTSR